MAASIAASDIGFANGRSAWAMREALGTPLSVADRSPPTRQSEFKHFRALPMNWLSLDDLSPDHP